jgi:hypothetical protein
VNIYGKCLRLFSSPKEKTMKQRIKHVEYEEADSKTGSATHKGVDEQIRETTHNLGGAQANAFEEGFAASSGVRPMAAASGGRVKAEENTDRSRPSPLMEEDTEQNEGLADN